VCRHGAILVRPAGGSCAVMLEDGVRRETTAASVRACPTPAMPEGGDGSRGDREAAASPAPLPQPGADVVSLLLGEDLRVALAVRMKYGFLSPSPRLAKPWLGEVPVGTTPLEYRPQVAPQLLDGGPPEEPVSHVDVVNYKLGLEYDRVRNHRVVRGIRLFGDVEILLHLPGGIREEGPVRAGGRAKLIGLDQVVRADRHEAAVADFDLAIKLDETLVLATILRAETAATQHDHHRIAILPSTPSAAPGPPPSMSLMISILPSRDSAPARPKNSVAPGGGAALHSVA